VRDGSFETAIYCGDLHRHSAEGNHAAVPDYMAWQTLWNGRLDFGAVIEHTSHCYSGFFHQNAVARRFEQDVDPNEREFVAFPGYEWTLRRQPSPRRLLQDFANEPAITDVAYPGAEVPPPTLIANLRDLLAAIRSHAPGPDRIAIAHHSLCDFADVTGAYDWGPLLDDPAQPVVEIFSQHGSSERYPVAQSQASDYVVHHNVGKERPPTELATVQDALAQGRRIGFVGGSDNHGAVRDMTWLCPA
jgi:hypothetical protein